MLSEWSYASQDAIAMNANDTRRPLHEMACEFHYFMCERCRYPPAGILHCHTSMQNYGPERKLSTVGSIA
jgi:hypothetical protein